MDQGSTLSSEESDSEIKNMKSQLNEFGLDEENLSKEEMSDLLRALRNSKTSAREDEISRNKVDENIASNSTESTKKMMKRKYLNVNDRRMPWSVFPSSLTSAEKARTLAVYIKLMSINSYHQARQSIAFAAWPPPIQIVEESTRVQPLRSTRSGRSVPIYAGFDDDSSDFELVITKNKKRRVSNSDNNGTDAVYSNKVVSLKRKSTREENTRPIKEAKINDDSTNLETITADNHQKPKKNIFTIIED